MTIDNKTDLIKEIEAFSKAPKKVRTRNTIV